MRPVASRCAVAWTMMMRFPAVLRRPGRGDTWVPSTRGLFWGGSAVRGWRRRRCS
uniref:Uncharacterized protein n=1 Tax=Human herpesvirus 1 TaxID=10298 RepID=A0A2Z4H873_HHV1|nr:hypothetical protein [Human alphaherpesvirus 1]